MKAPGFGDRRKAMLEDIAVLTGQHDRRRPRHQARERDPSDARQSQAGAHRRRTPRSSRRRQEADIEGRISQIRRRSRRRPPTTTRKLQERLAKLAGGVAIILGGSTEVEVKEKKDRVEDAMNATRPPSRAFLAAASRCSAPGGDRPAQRRNEDVQSGINIVLRRWKRSGRLLSSGVEGSIVVGKFLRTSRSPLASTLRPSNMLTC